VKRLLVVTAALFALAGCLDLETRIRIENDGSGRIRMLYEADADLVGYGMFDHDDSQLPVPFGERDFERLARETEGLALRSYERRERNGRVTVDAELSFATLEALNAVYAGRRDYVALSESNGRMQYTQVILESTVEELEEETRAFAEEFLAGYDLVFEVRAPSRIVDHNFGELSADARRVRYQSSMAEYVTSDEVVRWQLEWER